jgi:hypothetical protein
MPQQFKDKLPLNGKVRINWFDRDPEEGIYLGYQAGNPRRCAVTLPDGTNTWIDRNILEKI